MVWNGGSLTSLNVSSEGGICLGFHRDFARIACPKTDLHLHQRKDSAVVVIKGVIMIIE